ncbi:transthyretin [Hemibagrus wyckioides]|nr:transthyretin [Hemibagrus wyckioides]
MFSVCISSSTMARAIAFVLLASTLFCCQAAPVDRPGSSDVHCPLNVKILDALKGAPAGNVALTVFRQGDDQTWEKITSGNTNIAGEVHELLSDQDFKPGVYRVVFDTKTYWKGEGRASFHEAAEVVFEAHAEGHRHYTLALLLSPFSYTTTAVVGKGHD